MPACACHSASSPGSVSADSGASTQSMPAVRAQQLADVAQAVYERGGPGIHVPLDSSHALVAVLKAALEREAKERSGKQWKVRTVSGITLYVSARADEAVHGRHPLELPHMHVQAGRELAAALMEGFLAATEAKDQDTFPYLLVSH